MSISLQVSSTLAKRAPSQIVASDAPEVVFTDVGSGTQNWSIAFSYINIGDYVWMEYSTDNFTTIYARVSKQLTSRDYAGNDFYIPTRRLPTGTYAVRFYTTDAYLTKTSDYSVSETVTITDLDDAYITLQSSSSQSNSYSFANVSLTTVDDRTWITVGVMTNGIESLVAHDRLTATDSDGDLVQFRKINESKLGTNTLSAWEARVPNSNTLISPSVTLSGNVGRCFIAYYKHGRGSAFTSNAIALSNTVTINIPGNGHVITFMTATSTLAVNTTLANTTTEDFDQRLSAFTVTGATHTATSAQTAYQISASWTGDTPSNQRVLAIVYGDKR